jgi:ATP-binding cassette subfamily C protein LapB
MKSIIEHLALATRLHGTPVAAEALSADAIRTSGQSINYHALAEVLRSHGFENNLSQRRLDEIPSLALPVVLILQQQEAAVLTRVEGVGEERRYTIRQTDGLEQQLDHTQLLARYLGYCWFIKPKVAADLRSELPEYHLPKAWFWKVIWRFKPYYYQVVLATFIINFLALVSSLYVMNVYDRVIPNRAYETLWVLSIGVILAITFEFVAKLIRGHLTDIAGKKADLIISSALFRRVMALRLAERPASAGSYANNLRDFESVRDFMTSASLLALVDLPFLLLFVGVMFLIAGKLAIVPLVIIPIVILVGFLVQKPLAKYINESMREGSQRQGLAVEAIEGIETLKTNNATNWAQQRWDFYTAKTSASSIKVKDISNFTVNFAVAMQQLNTVFLVLYGTYLIHSDNPAEKITMGALIAAVILSGRALAPLGQIADLATRFQQARVALQGVNTIVERPIERSPDRQYISLDYMQGSIVFNRVMFGYQKETPPALKEFNLRIQPGEKVGILGRIGSGKTTMLKLAAGLYEAQQGNVCIDDVDTRQLDPSYLRNQVVLLNQSPRLFLGTLRENMDLGRSDGFSSDQDLLQALQRFGLAGIIRSHPRGLDMPLGEDGLGLSGGQKQIVALARLTLKQPRVVLLDEPTTGLDQGTENMALRAVAEWARDKTLVVVTHRPQVLQIVSRIVVVDGGQVVMDGPRDAVLKKLMENETAAQQQAQAVAQQPSQS